jgi:hypothetical protein
VGFWSAPDFPDARSRITQALPGFDLDHWGDQFERQLEAVGGALVLPAWDDTANLVMIRGWVAKRPAPVDVVGVLAALRPGEPIDMRAINPFALRDDPGPSPSKAEREAVDRVLDDMLRELGR